MARDIMDVEMNSREWLEVRHSQWEVVCRLNFETDATDDQLKVYRDYFYEGDFQKYIENGGFNDFESIFNWYPGRSLDEFIRLTENYWKWFDSYEDKLKLMKSYKCSNKEEYLNKVLLNLSGWTSFVDWKSASEYFLWVYGNEYEPNRLFPIELGVDNWSSKIVFNPSIMAFNLLRGVSSFVREGSVNIEAHKYKYQVDYFLSVIQYIDVDLFSLNKLKEKNKNGFSFRDQRVFRRLVAHIEGITTDDDLKKGNEIPEVLHSDITSRIKTRLSAGSFGPLYYKLFEFMDSNGPRCVKTFE